MHIVVWTSLSPSPPSPVRLLTDKVLWQQLKMNVEYKDGGEEYASFLAADDSVRRKEKGGVVGGWCDRLAHPLPPSV